MKKAVISVVDPDSVVVELSCRMRVETWRKVRDALNERNVGHYEHDVAEFKEAVNEAVRTVEQDFVGLGSSEAETG